MKTWEDLEFSEVKQTVAAPAHTGWDVGKNLLLSEEGIVRIKRSKKYMQLIKEAEANK